jgi:hypothetical protein
MPVTPNIIQTAKQTVKAQVLTNRTDVLPDLAIRTSKPSMPAVGADRHYAISTAAAIARPKLFGDVIATS